jgi:hypothetical protein
MPQMRKAIVVVFEGGFMDGKRVSTASTDPNEVEEAARHYFMSSEGTVGKRFCTYSEAGLREMAEITESTPDGPRLKREPVYGMDHVYELVERVEADDSTTLRFRYAGKFRPGDAS